MLNVSIARLRRVLTAALMLIVPVVASAGPVCESHAAPVLVLMRCRGSLSMGAHATSLDGEGDLRLYFRSPRDERRDGSWLEPGACAWADRAMGRDEPRVVVLPLNGPLAVDPYPIGRQGRACAGDNGCTMEFCAYDAGGELRAVDGFIRLGFGGLGQ